MLTKQTQRLTDRYTNKTTILTLDFTMGTIPILTHWVLLQLDAGQVVPL